MFIGFNLIVSNKAVKAMRQIVRKLGIRRRVDLDITDLSRKFNPIPREWKEYYGKFCSSAMTSVYIHFNSRWIKVHISLYVSSQEIIGYEITSSSDIDVKQLPLLLKKAPNTVQEILADGAYDTQGCREAIAKKRARFLIRSEQDS